MKFDPKLTHAVQDWLNTPENERDIMAGAEMMLSLNRNRALYNSILRNPVKYAAKLSYELRKYLRMRLDNVAAADVVRIEKRVMTVVQSTLARAPEISSEQELPAATVVRGRRQDHDSLPEEIRELWDSNADRYQRIRLLFNELKAMSDSQPCDRYEKLVILDELDKTYRSNLEKYDSYVPGTPTAEVTADSERTVNNARKTLSKYRKVLAGLDADDPKCAEVIEKIDNAAHTIVACGAGLAEETRAELSELGITFD